MQEAGGDILWLFRKYNLHSKIKVLEFPSGAMNDNGSVLCKTSLKFPIAHSVSFFMLKVNRENKIKMGPNVESPSVTEWKVKVICTRFATEELMQTRENLNIF